MKKDYGDTDGLHLINTPSNSNCDDIALHAVVDAFEEGVDQNIFPNSCEIERIGLVLGHHGFEIKGMLPLFTEMAASKT
jgi:hypothetical protein